MALALFLLPCAAAQAQRFMPQMTLGNPLASPERLGFPPGSAPPDLDEPEVGQQPDIDDETDTSPGTASGKREKPQPESAPPRHIGQNHDAPPPLPLSQRLRRLLRDSMLGGGYDFWFLPPKVRNVYFLAFESTRHDRYATIGNKRALFGTHDSAGWRVLAMRGFKVAAYDPVLAGRPASTPHSLKVMPGYEWRLGALSGALYAGLGYTRNNVTNTLLSGQNGRYGVNAMAEFWYSWGPGFPALARFTSGYVLAETAGRSLALGLRHGVAIPRLPFLIGPEAGWSAGRGIVAGPRISVNGVTVFRGYVLQTPYRAARLGLHASEIPLFATRLRLSGGVEWKDGRKPGGYAEIAAYVPY